MATSMNVKNLRQGTASLITLILVVMAVWWSLTRSQSGFRQFRSSLHQDTTFWKNQSEDVEALQLDIARIRGGSIPVNGVTEVNNTCVVYTYFDKMQNPSEKRRIEAEKTIITWTESWAAAGWRPRVLSEEDAKSHPQYLELRRKFEALPTVNPKEYEVSCFMRHVAMAAVGGGWMSDYDVLPFYMPRCLEPLNDGKFTVYQRHVPSFVSGNSSEFTRVANRMANVDYKSDPKRFTERGRFHVSDMHVLSHLLYTERAYIALRAVVSMEEVFDGTPVCECHSQAEDIPKGFPKLPWAIHYSHSSFRRIRAIANTSPLLPGSSWNAKRLRQNANVIRADFMADSFKYVQRVCRDVYNATTRGG